MIYLKDIIYVMSAKSDAITNSIAVLLIGGTIVCDYDPRTGLSTPGLGVQELLAGVDGLTERFSIVAEEFCNLPGTQLTLANGLGIARRIREVLRDESISGAVVIQGTDTLDEIAYLAELLLGPDVLCDKPVVFTGAMKSHNELYRDGAGNIYGAVQTAASRATRGMGVLIYMNQQIFAAADVEKRHASRIDAFSSPYGPLGTVEGGAVRYWRHPVEGKTFSSLLDAPSSAGLLPQDIYILKSYAGMDDRLVRACLSPPAKGLIMEAFGAGNVQPAVVAALEEAMAKGIPLLVTSRCYSGATFGTYDYDGGGAELQKKGAIFTDGLSSQKARILLSVLLAAGVTHRELPQYFSHYE